MQGRDHGVFVNPNQDLKTFRSGIKESMNGKGFHPFQVEY
jgi:hypothetical protein